MSATNLFARSAPTDNDEFDVYGCDPFSELQPPLPKDQNTPSSSSSKSGIRSYRSAHKRVGGDQPIDLGNVGVIHAYGQVKIDTFAIYDFVFTL